MYKIEFLLKDLRHTKNLTQHQLALKLNLSQSYISMLENNIKSPRLVIIEKIANTFEIDPFEFIIKKEI